jgi:hypothetical protein
VPAKTPEKLLASVPPSVIMNNKKSASMEFENFADFAKEGPSDAAHNGAQKDGSAGFDVNCQDNIL